MKLQTKRIYDEHNKDDGRRILVDRLWPRGVSKEKAAVDLWVKDLAPSHELRKWFNHKPEKWDEFLKRYFEELNSNGDALSELKTSIAGKKATLLYAAKDTAHNNAVALLKYLQHSKGAHR